MDFLELMRNRYTTKYYDPEKRISEDKLERILECLRLTPSSVNMQGWRFYLLDKQSKSQLRPAIPDFNVQRFDTCDKVLVLCAKTDIDYEWTLKVATKQYEDGRFGKDKIEATAKGCLNFAQQHRETDGIFNWTARQTYIAMATVLYACAAEGIDTTAIEGADFNKVNEIMKLAEQGVQATSLILLGYRSEKDSNTLDKRPKSRLNSDEVIIKI